MPKWRDEIRRRLEPLKLPPAREAEIVEEVAQHLDDRYRELRASGRSDEDAAASAWRELDETDVLGREVARVEVRAPLDLPPPGAPGRGRWLGALWQDARYVVRALRRTPAFALTVLAAVALTIGPTTAILSVANWLVWRPPPGVVDAGRLAELRFGAWREDGGGSVMRLSALNVADLQAASTTVASMAGWQETEASLSADGVPPRRVGMAHATSNLFDVLGVRPAAGRTFRPEEDMPPFGSPVAVISRRFARTTFGSEEAALDRGLTLNGRRLSVIGVLPAGFVGTSPVSDVDVWIPSTTYYYVRHFAEDRAARSTSARGSGVFYTFIARLQPEATVEAVRAEFDVLLTRLAERFPDDNEGLTAMRTQVHLGLGSRDVSRFGRLVPNLLAVGGVLLLLGCANVANLLISRGVRRQQERTVRLALGASRGRLVQLVLTESCLLAVGGAALGVALAVWLKDVMQWLLLPAANAAGPGFDVPIDGRVLLGTLVVSIGCGLLAGVVPAWFGSATAPQADLARGNLRTSTRRPWIRAAFAGVQLALSLALLTNALLLVATLRNFAGMDVGFSPRGISLHYVNLNAHGYDQQRAVAYSREMLDRLSPAAGFERVSFSYNHPFGGGLGIGLEDPTGGDGVRMDVDMNFVSDGYFEVTRIPLLAGRGFTRAEAMRTGAGDGAPAVVSEQLARRLFGDRVALGQRIPLRRILSSPAHSLVVVGVARDVRRSLTRPAELVLYVPLMHLDFAYRNPLLMVRSDLLAGEVGHIVQAAGNAIDATLPFSPPMPYTAVLGRELASQRVFAWVLSLLGALGFVLAALGLYGLLAQMVGERTREFGIRMAIGGDRAHVFGLVLRQAAWIALLGGAAGVGLGALGSRLIEAQLFGVTALEPWVYLVSAASLAAVVFVASVWPARQATRIEPVEALRAE